MPAIPPNNANPPRPGTRGVVNASGLPPPPPPPTRGGGGPAANVGGPAWGVQGQHPGDQGSGVYYYNSSPMTQQQHPSGPGGIVRGVAVAPSHTSAQHQNGWDGESVVSGTFPTTSSATSRSHSNDPWPGSHGARTPPRNATTSSPALAPTPNPVATTRPDSSQVRMVIVPDSEVNGYAEMFGLHVDIVKKVVEREQGDRDRTLVELERIAARINTNNNASPPRTNNGQGPYTGGYGSGAGTSSAHGRYGPAGPAFIPSAAGSSSQSPQVGIPQPEGRSPPPRSLATSSSAANGNPVQVDTILSVLTGSPSAASPEQRRIVASALNRSDGDVHRATNELLETGALFTIEATQQRQSTPQVAPPVGGGSQGYSGGGGGGIYGSPSSINNPPPQQQQQQQQQPYRQPLHQSAEDRLIREFTSCSLDDIKNALNLTDDDEQQAKLYLTNVVLLERREVQLRAAQHPSSMTAFSSMTGSTSDTAVPATWLNRARAMQPTHTTPDASPVVSSAQQPVRPLPTLPEDGEYSDFSASWRRTGISAPSPPSAHRDPTASNTPPAQQQPTSVIAAAAPVSGVTAVAPKGVAPPPPPKGKVPPPSKQPPPAAGVPPLALNTIKTTPSVPPIPIGPPKGAPPPPPGGKAGPKGPPPPLPPKKGVPPLPPMGGKKQPAAAASGEAEKTRKLFWQKLSTDAVSLEKTVWGAATPRGAMTPRMGSAAAASSSSPQSNSNPESIESVLSREEKGRLEEIFAKKPAGLAGGAQGKAAPIAAVRSVLDANRDKNVGIVLQFLRLPLDRIKTSVLSMSDVEGSMGSDAVSGLLSIVPTPEDIKAVDRFAPLLLSDAELSTCPAAKRNAKGDWEIDGVSAAQLSPSARFFIMTKSVPRFEQRLQCWDTMLTLETQVAELAKYMEVAVEAMGVPVGSEQFPVVLQFILSVGTFLNTGTTTGDASAGFRMSDLPKITSFKTSDNKGTMLSYLVDLVDRKNPEAHGFVQELEGLVRVTGSASTLVQIDIPQFKQQLSSMEAALGRCEGLLQALTRDLGDRDPVVLSLAQWLEKHGRPSVAAIKDHRLPATLDAAKELAEYFGEDVDGIVNATTSEGARQLHDLLKHIGNFSRDYGFELQKTREKAQRMGRQQQQQSSPPQSNKVSPTSPQPVVTPTQSRVVVPPSAVRREEAAQRQNFMDML